MCTDVQSSQASLLLFFYIRPQRHWEVEYFAAETSLRWKTQTQQRRNLNPEHKKKTESKFQDIVPKNETILQISLQNNLLLIDSDLGKTPTISRRGV